MFINTTFSISLIIKLIFLILFILITIYLVSLENEIVIRSNSKPLLQSSSRITKNIRDGVFFYFAALIAIQSLIERWFSTETHSKSNATSKENESQTIATSKENDNDLIIKNLNSTIQIQKEEINKHKALKIRNRKINIGNYWGSSWKIWRNHLYS